MACGVPANVHISAAEGFTAATSSSYEKGRPEWHDDLVAEVLRVLGAAGAGGAEGSAMEVDPATGMFPAVPLLEIAAGTGKFTRPFLKALSARGKPNVLIVEPTDMRKVIEENLGVPVLQTTADALGAIPDASVSGVVIAQAYHWFSNAESLAEIRRVLRPGGRVVFCWNMRDRTSVQNKRMEDLIQSFYDAATPRQASLEWQHSICEAAAAGWYTPLTHERVEYPDGGVWRTTEEMISWVMSISVIAKRAEDEKRAVIAELRDILAHWAAAAADPAIDEAKATGKNEAGEVMFKVPMYTDLYWIQKL